MTTGLKQNFAERSTPVPEGSDQSDKWEGVNDHYERFSTFTSHLFEINSCFVSIVNLYVQTFGVFKLKTSLMPSVCHSSLDILAEISAFNTLMKQHTEKVSSFGSEGKDRLKVFIDQFGRNLSWFIGMTAYKLIKVIKDEKESDKEKDASKKDSKETSSDKMHDLIV